MSRIKLGIPSNILIELVIPVRITDLNYGNHVGNDALISIVHEARVQWLHSLNFSELNFEGTGLIMAELAVEYMAESFYGDQLHIQISAGEISRAGFELYYLIQTARNGKEIIIAKAKTGMVCYNYAIKKVAAVPEKLAARLAVK